MSKSRLFQPLTVGNVTLRNRVVLAPLTRFRADDNQVPLPMVSEYYAQRASVPGTLLITEATIISPRAAGYSNVPGIWSKDQIAAWKNVTEAVHAKGSYIYLQLWALGRVAVPAVLSQIETGPYDVVSASAIPVTSEQPAPRSLTTEEIQKFTRDFATAAHNAVHLAGFDGVEVHGANGYLVDQFIQSNSNQRTDKYGGSVENRSRFALEVVNAISDTVGPERTAIRLSPFSRFQGMRMPEHDQIIDQFSHVITELAKLNISYVHLVEARVDGSADSNSVHEKDTLDFALSAWSKSHPSLNRSPVLLAGGFTPETAQRTIDSDQAQRYNVNTAIVFGRHFIPNPDLPFRIERGIPLTKYDRATFYKKGSPDGYIDYPFSDEFVQWQQQQQVTVNGNGATEAHL